MNPWDLLDPPGADPFDEPLHTASFSAAWLPYVLGALESLSSRSIWSGSEDDIDEVMIQVDDLIGRIAIAGEGCAMQRIEATTTGGPDIFRITWDNSIRYPLLQGTADLRFSASPVQAAIAINQELPVAEFGTAIRYVVYNATATHVLDDKFYAFSCDYMALSWQLQSAQSRYTWTINLHGIANGSQLLNRFTCTVNDINQPSGLRFTNSGGNMLASIENVQVFAVGNGVTLEQP